MDPETHTDTAKQLRVFRRPLWGDLAIHGPTRFGPVIEPVHPMPQGVGDPGIIEAERVVRAVARQMSHPIDAAARAERLLVLIGFLRRENRRRERERETRLPEFA